MRLSLLLILLFLLAASTFISAQEKGSHEIAVGYGWLSTNRLFHRPRIEIGSHFDRAKTRGTVYFTYKRAMADQVMIGASFIYELLDAYYDAFYGAQQQDISKKRFLTFGVEANVHYTSKPEFQMYSGLGLAYTFRRTEDHLVIDQSVEVEEKSYFNVQFSLLGFRFGGELAFYTEIGIGYKGLLNAGCSYQF